MGKIGYEEDYYQNSPQNNPTVLAKGKIEHYQNIEAEA